MPQGTRKERKKEKSKFKAIKRKYSIKIKSEINEIGTRKKKKNKQNGSIKYTTDFSKR